MKGNVVLRKLHCLLFVLLLSGGLAASFGISSVAHASSSRSSIAGLMTINHTIHNYLYEFYVASSSDDTVTYVEQVLQENGYRSLVESSKFHRVSVIQSSTDQINITVTCVPFDNDSNKTDVIFVVSADDSSQANNAADSLKNLMLKHLGDGGNYPESSSYQDTGPSNNS